MIIYCIEDINDLKYVGKTKQKLNKRFQSHLSNKSCSSKKLNLYNAIIYQLEECEEEFSKEREKYWINKIDCVNINKLNVDYKISKKKWNENNKEKMKDYYKTRYKNMSREQRDRANFLKRERRKLKKQQSKLK